MCHAINDNNKVIHANGDDDYDDDDNDFAADDNDGDHDFAADDNDGDDDFAADDNGDDDFSYLYQKNPFHFMINPTHPLYLCLVDYVNLLVVVNKVGCLAAHVLGANSASQTCQPRSANHDLCIAQESKYDLHYMTVIIYSK